MYNQKTPQEILGVLLGVLIRLSATSDSYGLPLAGMDCECDHQTLFRKKAHTIAAPQPFRLCRLITRSTRVPWAPGSARVRRPLA